MNEPNDQSEPARGDAADRELAKRDRWAAFGIVENEIAEEMQRVREASRSRADERLDVYRD